jgi:hypothetical protein
LRRRGQAVAVIQLDRWILPEGQRGEGVAGRYEQEAIEAALDAAASRADGGARLDLPAYSRRKRQRLPTTRRLALPAGAVVIWEGTLAVEFAARRGAAQRAIQLETDPDARRARFARYDQRRGLPDATSAANWAARERDEHPLLAAIGRQAGHAISLDAALAGAGARQPEDAHQP